MPNFVVQGDPALGKIPGVLFTATSNHSFLLWSLAWLCLLARLPPKGKPSLGSNLILYACMNESMYACMWMNTAVNVSTFAYVCVCLCRELFKGV